MISLMPSRNRYKRKARTAENVLILNAVSSQKVSYPRKLDSHYRSIFNSKFDHDALHENSSH